MQKQKEISTLVGIVIIIATIVILFGGIFAYKYFITRTQQNSEFLVSRQKTNQTQIQTASWKTYKNSYGYEIEYPSDWTYREFPGTKSGAGFRPVSKSDDYINEFIVVDNINRGSDYCDIDFSEYVKTAFAKEAGAGDQVLNSIKKVDNFANIETYETTWKYVNMEGKEVISLPITYFKSNKKGCSSPQLVLYNNDYLEMYRQMAKTFKLTEVKQTATNCIDSDGGLNYYTAGQAHVEPKNREFLDDYCKGNILIEAYCLNGRVASKEYTCQNGCSNGACIPAPIE